MLPFTSSRETFLAFPLCPPWNLPFLTVESTLSYSCSSSDPSPSSYQSAALTHLDFLLSYDLVLWTDGTVPFFWAKAALAYLPTALSVALRPLFPFQQAQFVQVSLLKPAPFCKHFAGLISTNKSAISLLLSFYLTLVLSSPPCPLLSFLPQNSLADLAGTVFSLLLLY